jgi:hypothetical protein
MKIIHYKIGTSELKDKEKVELIKLTFQSLVVL